MWNVANLFLFTECFKVFQATSQIQRTTPSPGEAATLTNPYDYDGTTSRPENSPVSLKSANNRPPTHQARIIRNLR